MGGGRTHLLAPSIRSGRVNSPSGSRFCLRPVAGLSGSARGRSRPSRGGARGGRCGRGAPVALASKRSHRSGRPATGSCRNTCGPAAQVHRPAGVDDLAASHHEVARGCGDGRPGPVVAGDVPAVRGAGVEGGRARPEGARGAADDGPGRAVEAQHAATVDAERVEGVAAGDELGPDRNGDRPTATCPSVSAPVQGECGATVALVAWACTPPPSAPSCRPA
jgi:hypothetical protein